MRSHRILIPVLSVALLAACDESPAEPEPTLLDEVREATTSFASTSAAATAGYVGDEHCVAHPDLGGMGHHWVNQDFVDPEFVAMEPEALLYEPTGDGGLELIGVEYIVIDAGQARPEFDGQPFDVGGVQPLTDDGVDHWSLHVWVHKENPSGTYAPFNPNVSCD